MQKKFLVAPLAINIPWGNTNPTRNGNSLVITKILLTLNETEVNQKTDYEMVISMKYRFRLFNFFSFDKWKIVIDINNNSSNKRMFLLTDFCRWSLSRLFARLTWRVFARRKKKLFFDVLTRQTKIVSNFLKTHSVFWQERGKRKAKRQHFHI